MLDKGVHILKGIGEKTEEQLSSLGIYTIKDLLFYFPIRYEIMEIKPLAQLIHNEQVTIHGQIVSEPKILYGRKQRTTFHVEVEGITVRAVMFHRLYSTKQFQPGKQITLTGKWHAHRLQITVSQFQLGTHKEKIRIDPIYSVKGKLTNARLKTIIQRELTNYVHLVKEILPENYLTDYYLPNRSQAIEILHQPQTKEQLKHARRRFIYEELLLYQLKIYLYREKNKATKGGYAYKINKQLLKDWLANLPFTFTLPQTRTLQEIKGDLQSPYQMYRLLQGDVGSGKTIVAIASLYAIVTAGAQGALMVPTEILAEQHVHTLNELLGDRVKISLLTSKIKGKQRKNILQKLETNDIQIVVGTHSLIQEDVHFYRLGLIVIDEQHRFGVEQRRKLREKGQDPDVLLMTATPIPRTLAITSYGDLDISIIDELPSGRKEVETYVVQENMLNRILQFVQKKIEAGEQAYFVSPLIEESEAFDYENAIDLYDKLRYFFPSSIRIGLLHGRLQNKEKEELMEEFVHNNIHILVSTTVIEVGVNVPNATIMVIYDAERFGLAQLHQLRGRVGRGEKQSYCILIAHPKSEVGKERMRIIANVNDGFKLAEEDLKLRGPGDFFGKKQSGLPEFKVADPVHHTRALEVARRDAIDIVLKKRLKQEQEFSPLKEEVMNSYPDQFD